MNGRDGEADAGESRLLAGYARWVVRHRRFVLAVVAGLTLLLGRAATRLHVEIDPDNQLPQDNPYCHRPPSHQVSILPPSLRATATSTMSCWPRSEPLTMARSTTGSPAQSSSSRGSPRMPPGCSTTSRSRFS